VAFVRDRTALSDLGAMIPLPIGKNQLPEQCCGLEGPVGCTHGDTDPADRDEARSSCYKHGNAS